MFSQPKIPSSFLFIVLCFFLNWINAQQDATCSATRPCLQGCCSQFGNCGFTEDFCGAGCQSNCNAKAECGTNSVHTLCPLGVCCSPFGFCGTTENFCGTGCQNGCAPVSPPSCPGASTNPMDFKRRVAYYELFGVLRPCDTMQPESIPGGALTHVNLAFAEFDSNFNIIDSQGDIVARVSRLKTIYPNLRVNIAVGGWNFNDPPTAEYWSNMVSTQANRQTFINSLMAYLKKYGLDGVDLDWEYPVADDRGGAPEDSENYVALVQQMRSDFDSSNPGYEISVTLPSSYWYMRGYDLRGLERHITYFNFLSYDLHGDWDFYNNYTGPFLRGQTNLTEIDQGFDLLWRNGVNPANVVMGMAFYGRAFTMATPSCSGPNCEFAGGGFAGDCSGTVGILIYPEIQSGNGTINAETVYDPLSTVKYTTFDYSQWVSYDDEQSWQAKLQYLAHNCLSGLMIWAIDQDTPSYDAFNALLGEGAAEGALLQGGDLSSSELDNLANEFAAFTGQNCYLTPVCTNGSPGQMGSTQVCASGYTSVSTQHGYAQIYPGSMYNLQGFCDVGWYRHICCPTSQMPSNCEWINEPPAGSIACGTQQCGSNQFQLSSDDYATAQGDLHTCQGNGDGVRRLCCDSTKVLDYCSWGACQGPFDDSVAASFGTPPLTCPSGTTLQTFRYDNGDGEFCSGIEHGSGIYTYAQPFCCPNNEIPSNCSWSNQPNANPNVLQLYDPASYCIPEPCSPGTVEITNAYSPPNSTYIFSGAENINSAVDCAAYQPPPGGSLEFPYCCNPPTAYNENWPVPPSYLWSNAYDDTGADVQWAYADNFGNDDTQTTANPEQYGDDPYGFIMLDGPDGSLAPTFQKDYTFTHEAHVNPNQKRSLVTSNLTQLDQVFEHKDEVAYVYCNHALGSPQCNKVFRMGAIDTIIRLPGHVGEGPFGRIVSMELAENEYVLAAHHVRARSIDKNANPVFKIKFDYNFHLIKRAEQINVRVDYTNLEDYWQSLTDTPASKKRSVQAEHISHADFKERVIAAKTKHWERKGQQDKARRANARRDRIISRANQIEPYVPTKLGKRWFGSLVSWLGRVTSVESKAVGYLNMVWNKSALLYRAVAGCPASTAYASLSIYLDSNVNLEATYAYYFSGSITGITGTYAYFGVQPSAYLGVNVVGYAQLQYNSDRVKLIQTIAYPGLAIKGLAAVGPTLDVYGQIKGLVTLSGQMQIGFRFNFEKQEWFWPDDADTAKYNQLLDLDSKPQYVPTGIVPEFSGSVQATAQLDILVTPEANMGIKIGGGSLIGTLVNAQLVAYVNTTLRFMATAGASTNGAYSYSYGVSFLYNIGYGAVAQIPLFPWYARTVDLYNPPKEIPLYKNPVSSSNKKRSFIDDYVRNPGRGLLNGVSGDDYLLPRRQEDDYIKLARTDDQLTGAETGDSLGRNPINASIPSDGTLNSFQKRQQANPTVVGDNPDFSLSQLFTCPSTQGCATCGCMHPSKRDLDGFDGDETISERATGTTSTCPSILPEYRINCNVFADSQANGNGNSEIIEGICSPQNTFMNLLGYNQAGIVLTYDGGSSAQNRIDTRRGEACGDQFCLNANALLDHVTGSGTNVLSCDEFPFASVEEGGSYYGSLPGSPVSVSTVCVPVWQQQLQSLCNGLPGNLATNVLYHDFQLTQTQFVAWTDAEWTDTQPALGTTADPIFQRLAVYPTAQNQRAGPNTGNPNESWMFKRNFTYGLAFPNANGNNAWAVNSQNALQSWTPQTGGASSTDGTKVVCAVNLFGQDAIYSHQYAGNFNAWCLTGRTQNSGVFGQTPMMRACTITWATGGGTTTKKRDNVIGSFGEWDIESIQVLEDEESLHDDLPQEAWDNMGPAMPYEAVKRAKTNSSA